MLSRKQHKQCFLTKARNKGMTTIKKEEIKKKKEKHQQTDHLKLFISVPSQ